MGASQKPVHLIVLLAELSILLLQAFNVAANPICVSDSTPTPKEMMAPSDISSFADSVSGHQDAVAEIDQELEMSEYNEHLLTEGNGLISPSAETSRVTRDAEQDKRWPDATVPYRIDSSFDIEDVNLIEAAMDQFQKKSCIRFQEYTNQADYVYIVKSDEYSSLVGRVRGRQEILLNATIKIKESSIVHELMHSLGFDHEHSRMIRNKYVTIIWKNIKKIKGTNLRENFKKINNSVNDQLNTSYDFKSIMHYHNNAYSIDECIDRNTNCSHWKDNDHCNLSKDYMFKFCPESCGLCGPCSDSAVNSNDKKCWDPFKNQII